MIAAAPAPKCDKAHHYGDTAANVKEFIAEAHTKHEPLQSIMGGGDDEYDDFLTHTCRAKLDPKSAERAYLNQKVWGNDIPDEQYNRTTVTDLAKASAGAALLQRQAAHARKHPHAEIEE